MKHLHLWAGMAILLGWASVARAQASLGSPQPRLPDHVCVQESHAAPVWQSPVEISAAKIMLDEMQTNARCAAVRYLASVDCHYYPEAEFGLIAALRTDRVEAVRLEAALALGYCRGTTMRTTQALHMAAQGMDSDGNPAETSERVRAAACLTLQRLWTWTPPPIYDHSGPTDSPADWCLVHPQVMQPGAYLPPAYLASGTAWLPPPTPALARERARAATVSTQNAPPSTVRAPRRLYDFLVSLTTGHDAGAGTGRASSALDSNTSARLQGLRPLGSAVTLAIPTSYTPYNFQE